MVRSSYIQVHHAIWIPLKGPWKSKKEGKSEIYHQIAVLKLKTSYLRLVDWTLLQDKMSAQKGLIIYFVIWKSEKNLLNSLHKWSKCPWLSYLRLIKFNQQTTSLSVFSSKTAHKSNDIKWDNRSFRINPNALVFPCRNADLFFLEWKLSPDHLFILAFCSLFKNFSIQVTKQIPPLKEFVILKNTFFLVNPQSIPSCHTIIGQTFSSRLTIKSHCTIFSKNSLSKHVFFVKIKNPTSGCF